MNIVFPFWYIKEIYPDRQFVPKIKSWDPMVWFWQPLKNIKIILKFSDLLGFAIGKVGVLRLPWAAKIKRGHLEWSGVFPLGLDRHKRVYKVSTGQLPTDFFEFQCDTFLRRWLRPPPMRDRVKLHKKLSQIFLIYLSPISHGGGRNHLHRKVSHWNSKKSVGSWPVDTL